MRQCQVGFGKRTVFARSRYRVQQQLVVMGIAEGDIDYNPISFNQHPDGSSASSRPRSCL